ncbi:MAG TPA: helix-turn-helix domain-containing protein [Candidatus Dormibacteraeota bacterium]|nr:helix-turn-helix domain-containing protein [Candidatus Dormibacteraeota bacterium]
MVAPWAGAAHLECGGEVITVELLRVEEVAELLRVGRTKVYQLLARGELPVVRIGRSVRVPRRRLLAWIEAHTVGDENGVRA